MPNASISSVSATAPAPPATNMPSMGGMEHPMITVQVPPLVDRRVFLQFSRAVQTYAGSVGLQDVARARLTELHGRIQRLQDLASLCRLAILGHPRSFSRVQDEMACIAADYSTEPLDLTADLPDGESDRDDRAQLALVFDLLAGATFVSKDDSARRDQLIAALSRAVEDAICYPLAFSAEAAVYPATGEEALAPTHAAACIANATRRLLEGDASCDPPAPRDVRRRLARMAADWMRANPVTEMFRALTGPRLDGILAGIQPDDAQNGDRVTLQLESIAGGDQNAGNAKGGLLKDVFVLFSPAEPAKILGSSANEIVVQVPDHAHSGPVAIVRQPDVAETQGLLESFAVRYPVEWFYSLFSCIPMWKWAWPEAFETPWIEITQVPRQARVLAFTSMGMLADADTVDVGDAVTIQWRVEPPGSDANASLYVSAAAGTVTRGDTPGILVYRPTQYGNGTVELEWGALRHSIRVQIARKGMYARGTQA